MKFSVEFTLEELDLVGAAIARDRDDRALPSAGLQDTSQKPRLMTAAEDAAVPLHQMILQKIEEAVSNQGPRRISDREVAITITGYFMPTHAPNAPVLIGMPGTDDLFIVVFSSETQLVAIMTSFGIEYARMARVTDGHELIDEIKTMNAAGGRPYRIRLAIDPYKAVNGALRFTEPLYGATEVS